MKKKGISWDPGAQLPLLTPIPGRLATASIMSHVKSVRLTGYPWSLSRSVPGSKKKGFPCKILFMDLFLCWLLLGCKSSHTKLYKAYKNGSFKDVLPVHAPCDHHPNQSL